MLQYSREAAQGECKIVWEFGSLGVWEFGSLGVFVMLRPEPGEGDSKYGAEKFHFNSHFSIMFCP